MPLIIPRDLIGEDVLQRENIFVIGENRAQSQDIRPIKVAIVNLMPKKEETEIQFLRMLSNTALQINIDLIRMGSHNSKNTEQEHLEKFYKTYEEIKDNKYDAMIITGAPVEKLEYENIKYWDELKSILEFAKTNVYSTMFICWAAQAALYYYYDIDSEVLDNKIFGVFEFEKLADDKILKGFDDEFLVPHSRHTYVREEEVRKHSDLKILASREDTGVGLVTTEDNRFIFSFGHWEYDKETLHNEYIRDLSKGLKINLPKNYYKNNNPKDGITIKWRTSGNLFFSNWLNYCVYQVTPFHIEEIEKKSVSKFGGSSLSDAKQFSKVKSIVLSEDERDIIVVSAPGKRDSKDEKVTDLLINISELKESQNKIERVLAELKEKFIENEKLIDTTVETIKNRFKNIAIDLNLDKKTFEEIENSFKDIESSQSRDFIVSRGEYLNAKLMAKYLDYEFIDAKDLINFNSRGEIDFEKSYENVREKMSKGKKFVVPGFYGRDVEGNIRTFNRGGSDFTGSIIASALNSKVYENWTDVNGVMTSDPKKDRKAETIPTLNYDEFGKIIEDGAEIYQKEAIAPVREKNIMIKILNTNNPNSQGTIVKD
ncbi:homoserine O-acetyltransferase/O-succinyltransferase family protein [Anaerosphaera multitolerans]|uniref:Homoserine O-acetyltransferase n=1 Tax=Anaerosphaera multitolerans TaxID=2487351 RepID=A0A437S739_9FIRM|nr:homoserine O-succinyltransferase [Anaerosphaera multitolerans]RVU54845.1 homoserine O-succinyltransferase [Anaerosphaera multitolerans]